MTIIQYGEEIIATQQDLSAEKHIYIAPMTSGVIPHDYFLEGYVRPVMLIAREGVFIKRHLWVETCIVGVGKLQTNVFNMGNEQVKIHRGEVVSQLIEL